MHASAYTWIQCTPVQYQTHYPESPRTKAFQIFWILDLYAEEI
jgi:hypothetical protein